MTDSATAAKANAEAARISAEAASKSAQAAQDAVGVNAESAAGIAKRAEADALAKRYHDAAEQLGHDKAPVRLAGVYAMARLADDWPEQRQTCVDVLCAYVRMPIGRGSDGDDAGEIEVRSSIFSAMSGRLSATSAAPSSWSDLTFDFSNSRLINFRLRRPRFGESVNFANATFEGECFIEDPIFAEEKEAYFENCKVEGSLEIGTWQAGSGTFSFRSTRIGPEGQLRIAMNPQGDSESTWLPFTNLIVEGGLRLQFQPGNVRPLSIILLGLEIGEHAYIEIGGIWTRAYAETPDPAAEWPEISAFGWRVSPGARILVAMRVIHRGVDCWKKISPRTASSVVWNVFLGRR
jgi:hypothetical protein